jgi:hypothetical protein
MQGFHIRVTRDDKGIRFEMMDGDYKLRDVTDAEIINMIMQAASALRWR